MKNEHQALMKALAGSRNLEPAINDFIRRNAERIVYHRGHTLQERGAIPSSIYFIAEGAARICFWYTDKDRQQHKTTSAFISEGEFVFTPHSFFARVPCIRSIELIGRGKVHTLSYSTVAQARARFLDMNLLLDDLKDRYYQRLTERSFVLGLKLVADRYCYLAEHKPWLFDEVPMEPIATYLGTSRETLTRIRSRIG